MFFQSSCKPCKAVFGDGKILVGGYFASDNITIGAFTLQNSAVGFDDAFIAKYDSSGNVLWAQSIGGSSDEKAFSVAADASGNVYTTGYFRNTVDFDPGSGVFNLTSAGGGDIFISKLDNSGNFVWARAIGGTPANAIDKGNAIALDNSGNVYTTGRFLNTVDFDPGAGVFNITAAGEGDVFISKLNSSGNFVWAIAMGGTDGEEGLSIALDASENIYTTGGFEETADFDPGAGVFNLTSNGYSDIFISKLDNAGSFIWAKAMGGTNPEGGESIALDAFGNVYTTGQFLGTVDFNPGSGVNNLTSAGGRDIFISKLDNAGNFVWAKRMGGTDWDAGYSIAID